MDVDSHDYHALSDESDAVTAHSDGAAPPSRRTRRDTRMAHSDSAAAPPSRRSGTGWRSFCGSLRPPSRAVTLLCLYVFFKTMKPSEQYLTKFLVSVKHLSESSINQEVYPLWTYCAMAMAVLAFFFTDYVGYRNVVRGEALAYLATRVLLVWGTTLLDMQLTQVFYAMATSTELGYLAYVYNISDEADYQRVASLTRASILVAELAASIIAQAAVAAANNASLLPLNYVSMISVIIACCFAAALPPPPSPTPTPAPLHTATCNVDTDTPRHAGHNGSLCIDISHSTTAPPTKPTPTPGVQRPSTDAKSLAAWSSPGHARSLAHRWRAFRLFYGRWHNVRWSLWAAAGTCGLYQVENFNQSLWEVQSHGASTYNGAVGAVVTLLGVGAAVLPSYLSRTGSLAWVASPEPLIALLSCLCGVLLFIMGASTSVLIGYIGYAAFKVIYCFTATVASAQVATCAKTTFGTASGHLFGLVYGFNTLVALAMESLLQLCVGPHVFHLHVRSAFRVYGVYFAVLAASFLAVACCCANNNNKQRP